MSQSSIVIIDYGVGNLHSLARAFRQVGVEPVITEETEVVAKASGVVLPGVGAFAAGMQGLERRGLTSSIQEVALQGVPILGICLGAQLLLTQGHEFGTFKGLDVIPGQVVSFPELAEKEKIPHVGWNAIERQEHGKWNNSLLSDIEPGSQVYFVHSYILEPSDPKDVLAVTTYGGHTFCSALQRGVIMGCQFHPEKSGPIGLRIINNFVHMTYGRNHS